MIAAIRALVIGLATVGLAMSAGPYRGKGFVITPSPTATVASSPVHVQFYDTATASITDLIELKASSAEVLLQSFVENHPILLEFRAEFDRSSQFCSYGNWVGRTVFGKATIQGVPVTIQAIAMEANGTTYLLVMQSMARDFGRMQRFIDQASSLRFDRVPKLSSSGTSAGGASGACPGCDAALSSTMQAITQQTLQMMR